MPEHLKTSTSSPSYHIAGSNIEGEATPSWIVIYMAMLFPTQSHSNLFAVQQQYRLVTCDTNQSAKNLLTTAALATLEHLHLLGTWQG